MFARLTLFAVGLTLTILVGCSHSSRRFDAVSESGDLGGEARVILESSVGEEGTIVMDLIGAREETLDGIDSDVARMRIIVDNGSTDAVSVPLSSIRLTDDAGRVWRQYGLMGTSEGEAQQGHLVVEPHSRRSVEMLFDSGATGILRTTGSLTAEWDYSFRSQQFSHRNRFLQRRYRTYSSSSWVGFGLHDPFWYGGWGHRHRGYRLHGGSHLGFGWCW